MPNAEVWGNALGNQNEEQDLVSPVDPEEGDPAIIRVNDVNNNDAARPAIYAKNRNVGANARALKVEGTSELRGHVNVHGPLFITGVENGLYSKNNDPLLIGSSVDTGEVIIGGDHDNVRTVSNLRVQNGLDGTNSDLNIGATNRTNDVNIGRDDQDVNVVDDLNVGGDLQVGAAAAAGVIDAGGDPAAQNLQIGSGNSTADVQIGRNNQNTIVRSNILKVGPANNPGGIDSGGTQAAPQHLKIGVNNVTEDVIIGRDTRTVVVQTQVRMNENAIIMNNGTAIDNVNACGIVLNPAGHAGIPAPTFDFVVWGLVVACIDANGAYHQNP